MRNLADIFLILQIFNMKCPSFMWLDYFNNVEATVLVHLKICCSEINFPVGQVTFLSRRGKTVLCGSGLKFDRGRHTRERRFLEENLVC